MPISNRLSVLLITALLSGVPVVVVPHTSAPHTSDLPSPAPHTSAPAVGSISGTVLLSSALASRRPEFRIYAEPGTGALTPKHPAVNVAGEMKNLVIYLEASGSSDALASTARADSARHGRIPQIEERFTPHVLPVMQGATVDFPNEDDVFHNVFSLSSAKAFDLGRYPRGSSKSVTFNRTGTVQVFCHIHGDMSAVVLVLPNPYFVSPDASGHYTLDGVPEGDYTIVGWHERARAVSKRIHVSAGHPATADFNIPVPPGEAAGH
ncbi:MAG: hypothetical protein JWO05_3297 [Gemmatimonadetes bacterium]|nr:hypothetical protein [Gemmatimonadota bacterium]